MLAVLGQPFDSDSHFFEIKWDGFRAAAMIENGSVRLMSRNRNDLAEQFPALRSLRSLPDGLALDGEIVAFRDGKPDFDLMLNRGRAGGAGGARGSRALKYVAFDVLYRDYQSRLDLGFAERREILEEVLAASRCAELMLSDGVKGRGKELYRQACEQSLEGVVAKKLSSPYAAGKRNGAWIKIKRRLRIQVVVIGYIEKPGNDFQSLLVAASQLPGETAGPLRYLGRVGGGFTEAMRANVYDLLQRSPRGAPLVPCPERGRWVEPTVYCEVSYAELTEAGQLRAPVFEGLIES